MSQRVFGQLLRFLIFIPHIAKKSQAKDRPTSFTNSLYKQ